MKFTHGFPVFSGAIQHRGRADTDQKQTNLNGIVFKEFDLKLYEKPVNRKAKSDQG